jgi:AraC family transcriptional regulator
MKPNQRVIYADRIENVIRHLVEHDPGRPLPALTELAKVANLSEFHFHRIYRLMTGETPADTVRRLRLARAVPELAGSSGSVTAAAGAAGYATGPAFTRALKAQTGVSGLQARRHTAAMQTLIERLRAPAAGTDKTSAPIKVEITSFAPLEVIALRNVGDYAELNAAYTRLFERVFSVASPEQIRGIWGVHYDDPASAVPDECRFDCCLEVAGLAPVPDGLEPRTLGGGPVARLTHYGSYDDIATTIDTLYHVVIDDLDRAPAAAPLFVHYRHDPEEVAQADLEAVIYLPLT